MLALQNARVFNGISVMPGRHTVILDGAKIHSIGEGSGVTPTQRIDLGGMTLMLGMISSHLHADFYKYTFENFSRNEQLGKERPRGVLTIIGAASPDT